MTLVMGLMIFFLGLMIFFSNRKNILMLLLGLEVLVMSLLLLMMMIFDDTYEMILFFMIMSVCEACFGLSLMIMIVNFYGSSVVNSMMMVK